MMTGLIMRFTQYSWQRENQRIMCSHAAAVTFYAPKLRATPSTKNRPQSCTIPRPQRRPATWLKSSA